MAIVQHTMELGLLVLLVIGPLPFCVMLVRPFMKPDFGLAHNLLSVAVGWCVIQVLLGLILGSFHLFNAGVILWIEAVGAAFGTIGIALSRGSSVPMIPGVIKSCWERAGSSGQVLLGFAGFFGVALFVKITSRPIVEFDSLSYHMPAMAKWYQSGSFVTSEQLTNLYNRFPYNWEVLCALFFAPFAEDFLLSFPQLIAWLIFGLSIHCMTVRCGASTTSGIAAAVLAISIPGVIEQVYAAQVDLAVGAFFLSGLYFLIVALEEQNPAAAGWALGSLGMLAGIKTSGAIYCVIAIIGSLLWRLNFFVADVRKILSSKAGKSTLAFGVIAGIVLGAFWYVRNWRQFGNPLGIVAIRLAGFEFFPGPKQAAELARTSLASLFDVTDLRDWIILFNQIAERLYLPFVVLLLLAVGAVLRFSNNPRTERVNLAKLVAVGAITGMAYWMTPYTGDAGQNNGLSPDLGQVFRYGLPAIGVVAVLGGIGLAQGLFTNDATLAAIVVVVAILGLMRADVPYLPELIVLACAICVLVALIRPLWASLMRGRLWKTCSVIITCISVVLATYGLRRERDARRYLQYGGIYEFVQNKVSKSDVIGYALSTRSYLLYGKHWDRKVVYSPVVFKEDGLKRWMDELARRGITLVAIGPIPKWMIGSEPDAQWLSTEKAWILPVLGRNWRTETVLFRLATGSN